LIELLHSVLDLKNLKQMIKAADLSFDDLRPFTIVGFNGLYVLRKTKAMKISHWLRLNHLLANLGYCAVFVAELERLQFLSSNLDLAQEFFQEFELDLAASEQVLHSGIFAAAPPPAAPAPAFGQEILLRQKLKQALENLHLHSTVSEPTGYATAMQFLAGESCVLTTEAFEQAALKLDQLESIELVDALDNLRQRHKVPTVSDYEQAARQLDLEAWLEVRQDPAIETRIEQDYAEAEQVAATRAQEFVDQVQYLLLVPVATTEMVPGFFHLGGVNDMPAAHVHMAFLRRWKKTNKARLLGVGPDALYVHLEKPALTDEKARHLAIEHFRYCPDNVMQSMGTISRLADEIKGCDLWQFWWE